jgi:pimeloyl-ACP methyl ester carboxylesterase
MTDLFEEKEYLIRGVHIRVKHWHAQNTHHPVIALHGWLDNAASFDLLAPLLSQYSIAAIDLAGQGFSENRPASATYHLWDDLLDILAIADELGWQKFSLIGHSRGAMLSVMLAASCAERIKHIVLLDGLMPIPVNQEDAAKQLMHYLIDYRQPNVLKTFKTRKEAIFARAKVGGLSEAAVELLASRQLRQHNKQWLWVFDERLKAASALKLTYEQNKSFLDAICCNATVILANSGWGESMLMKDVREQYSHFSWYSLEGSHHLHLDGSQKEVAQLCINALQ